MREEKNQWRRACKCLDKLVKKCIKFRVNFHELSRRHFHSKRSDQPICKLNRRNRATSNYTRQTIQRVYVELGTMKLRRLRAQRTARINPSRQISNKPQIPSFYHTRDYFWNTRVLACTDLATPRSNSFNSVSNRKPDRPNLSHFEHVQCRAKVLAAWSILSWLVCRERNTIHAWKDRRAYPESRNLCLFQYHLFELNCQPFVRSVHTRVLYE